MSEDHEDLQALTPNHFLIGRNFYNDCLVNDKGCMQQKKVAPSSDITRSVLEMLAALIFAVFDSPIKMDSAEETN